MRDKNKGEYIITDENLIKLQNEHPMIPLTFDVMLKAFFERNPLIYKMFVSSVLHLELIPEEMDLINKNTELSVDKFTEYSKKVDFYADINRNILINIELNSAYFKDVKERNDLYNHKKIAMLLRKGSTKEDIKRIGQIMNIQLNLNIREKMCNLGEDIVVPYSIKTHTIYLNNQKTYIRYLDYYRKLYYNSDIELKEDEYWLVMLTSKNYLELNDILSNFLSDELREEIIKDVIDLSQDDEIFSVYDQKNGDILVEHTIHERLLKEGIEQGNENTKIEIAKKLLEQGISFEVISKSTDLSIEEIKKLN